MRHSSNFTARAAIAGAATVAAVPLVLLGSNHQGAPETTSQKDPLAGLSVPPTGHAFKSHNNSPRDNSPALTPRSIQNIQPLGISGEAATHFPVELINLPSSPTTTFNESRAAAKARALTDSPPSNGTQPLPLPPLLDPSIRTFLQQITADSPPIAMTPDELESLLPLLTQLGTIKVIVPLDIGKSYGSFKEPLSLPNENGEVEERYVLDIRHKASVGSTNIDVVSSEEVGPDSNARLQELLKESKPLGQVWALVIPTNLYMPGELYQPRLQLIATIPNHPQE